MRNGGIPLTDVLFGNFLSDFFGCLDFTYAFVVHFILVGNNDCTTDGARMNLRGSTS